jgi:hypothetical protein
VNEAVVEKAMMMKSLCMLCLFVTGHPGPSQTGTNPDVRIIVVRDANGAPRGRFQTRAESYRPDIPLPIQVALGSKNAVRAKDGLIVNGFGFYAWDEGPVIHLRIFELVPAAGLENKYWWTGDTDARAVLQARELAAYKLKQGEKRVIDEMKALGVQPMQVSVESQVPRK